jgi:DHA1 family bicyclomycin/chloramphenicol resistance-like MFS transporter
MEKHNKSFIILLLGALSAIGPFSIDMYLPSFASIASDFKIGIELVGYSLSSYFIGISIGQLVYGPVIDRFGRKMPLLAGLAIYLVSTMLCMFSTSINMLIVSRFFLALGGCAGMVASRAVIRDLFEKKEIARVFSIITLVMGIAPIVAPTVGGFINNVLGWRFIFLALTLFSTAMILLIFKFLPETGKNDNAVSLKPLKVIKKYLEVIGNRQFLIYTLCGGILFSGLFAYISGSPFVFIKLYGIPDTYYGYLFGINALGYVAGSQLNRILIRKFRIDNIAMFFCTVQFFSMILLMTGLISGLFSHAAVMSFLFVYILSLGFTTPNSLALALEPFVKNAGSASAMLGSIQMVIGASTSGLVSLLFNGTELPMYGVIAGCAIVAFLLLLINKFFFRKIVPDNPETVPE